MVTKFIDTIKRNNMLSHGDKILCALSGGVDSSVLLELLKHCEDELGITVCAAHLNHMLRGEDANKDEEFVCEKCKKLGIEIICERADIGKIAKERGESTELVARNVRYDFLRRAKETFRADKIATAHNANDNAETILFNLTRGSGIDGVCGIPPVRDDIIRPLIETTRLEIEEYAQKHNIEFCVDKTNFETVYSRNKLRHNAIPALLEINMSAIENISRSSRILKAEAEFIKREAEKAAKRIAKGKASCLCKDLLSVDKALFSRVCEQFAKEVLANKQYTLEFCHVNDIHTLCENANPSKSVDLPGGIRARREYELLIFEKSVENERIEQCRLDIGEYSVSNYLISVNKIENNSKIHNSVNTFLIPCDKIYGNLVVRCRNEHDEIKLAKRPTKSLKKLFVEARVPKMRRENIPVIADEKNVLAVYGFGQNEIYLPKAEEKVFYIEIKKVEG